MKRASTDPPVPVAVIGMACRTAGADDLTELWGLFAGGARAIGTVPEGRWDGLDPGRVTVAEARAGLLEDLAGFDASFFKISRRAAAWADPQQRILLELAWHALEDAGVNPRQLEGAPVAVFTGSFASEYRDRMIRSGRVDGAALTGTLVTYLANRVSYHFDWKGPSLTLDTGCSAGMSALALAVSGLRAGEFPLAMVSAASTLCDGFYPSAAFRGGALSPTGRSTPFSSRHDGYVRGEGGVCLLLKPLPEALRDGDPVRALILASATAHDGRAGGLTGTDADSQARLICRAARTAGIPVAALGHLEAHGTGTAGDAVEVAGLRRALAEDRESASVRAGGPGGKIWVGTAKANVGHLEAAAGLLGVVKAVLSLEHGLIPAIPGLDEIQPGLVDDGPVALADHPVPWPATATGAARRVGVNSFGLGGSNAHVILEEAPQSRSLEWEVPAGPLVFPLSGRTEQALRLIAGRLERRLGTPAPPALVSVSWTLQHGRTAHPVRALIVADALPELRAALTALAENRPHPLLALPGSPVAPAVLNDLRAGDGGARHDAAVRWLEGGTPYWEKAWPGTVRPPRVALDTPYPFDHAPHWFDTDVPPHPRETGKNRVGAVHT
ncbi:polyketide synthase [Streptomyces shenzhenensis]|uniref:Polyketide synthase n=1 Tax=Streptomyces shenzhenensis TaxID=943815 RepID=A0A3M0IHM0_9ACTN|nr:polyketide synthase [Streptomyces shenzhenensis]RMB81416.1 polyketide synthase [Streptomyces shenzhenensis]